jgi:hypothetical protein
VGEHEPPRRDEQPRGLEREIGPGRCARGREEPEREDQVPRPEGGLGRARPVDAVADGVLGGEVGHRRGERGPELPAARGGERSSLREGDPLLAAADRPCGARVESGRGRERPRRSPGREAPTVERVELPVGASPWPRDVHDPPEHGEPSGRGAVGASHRELRLPGEPGVERAAQARRGPRRGARAGAGEEARERRGAVAAEDREQAIAGGRERRRHAVPRSAGRAPRRDPDESLRGDPGREEAVVPDRSHARSVPPPPSRSKQLATLRGGGGRAHRALGGSQRGSRWGPPFAECERRFPLARADACRRRWQRPCFRSGGGSGRLRARSSAAARRSAARGG